MISARAYGVLSYLQDSQSKISAEALSAVFPEGRKAMLAALKELREAGYITTSRQVVKGKFVTQSYLGGSPKRNFCYSYHSCIAILTKMLIQLYIIKEYLEQAPVKRKRWR